MRQDRKRRCEQVHFREFAPTPGDRCRAISIHDVRDTVQKRSKARLANRMHDAHRLVASSRSSVLRSMPSFPGSRRWVNAHMLIGNLKLERFRVLRGGDVPAGSSSSTRPRHRRILEEGIHGQRAQMLVLNAAVFIVMRAEDDPHAWRVGKHRTQGRAVLKRVLHRRITLTRRADCRPGYDCSAPTRSDSLFAGVAMLAVRPCLRGCPATARPPSTYGPKIRSMPTTGTAGPVWASR
jgi:hypothetical protein